MQVKTNSKKEEKIIRLWERGVRDTTTIARKLGYKGNAMTSAIESIKQVLASQGSK